MNQTQKSPDEIMAEYLLAGAKMLAEICPTCSAPLFEVSGKKMCVVCDGKPKEQTEKNPENLTVITPKYAAAFANESNIPKELPAALDALILQFCKRAETEPDPTRCLTYMECIRTATEARTMLKR